MLSQSERKAIIIAKLQKLSVNGSCRSAGVAKSTYYNWTKEDPEFAAACELARAQCEEDLIDLARKDKGSSMKLLAALFRDDYRESTHVTVEGLSVLGPFGRELLATREADRAAREAADDIEDDEAQDDIEVRAPVGEDVEPGVPGTDQGA